MPPKSGRALTSSATSTAPRFSTCLAEPHSSRRAAWSFRAAESQSETCACGIGPCRTARRRAGSCCRSPTSAVGDPLQPLAHEEDRQPLARDRVTRDRELDRHVVAVRPRDRELDRARVLAGVEARLELAPARADRRRDVAAERACRSGAPRRSRRAPRPPGSRRRSCSCRGSARRTCPRCGRSRRARACRRSASGASCCARASARSLRARGCGARRRGSALPCRRARRATSGVAPKPFATSTATRDRTLERERAVAAESVERDTRGVERETRQAARRCGSGGSLRRELRAQAPRGRGDGSPRPRSRCGSAPGERPRRAAPHPHPPPSSTSR